LRKAWIGVVTGAFFFAAVGIALALTNNTVNYSSTVAYKGKAGKKPKNMTYTGTLEVSTADGKQPNTGARTDVFFARQIKNNARKFRKCKRSQIDGKQTVPRRCKRARVGGGTASAQLGQPGGDGLTVNLDVDAYNGPRGRQILLAVTGPPATQITNRVIPGTVQNAPAPFGFKVVFRVPEDLQQTAGAQVALTNFNVRVNKVRKYKVRVRRGGRRRKVTRRQSYLQFRNCPAAQLVPTRATVFFDNDDGSPGGQVVTHNGSMACK
jgi:hypothetical protein